MTSSSACRRLLPRLVGSCLVFAASFLAGTSAAASGGSEVPEEIVNWTAPPYWTSPAHTGGRAALVAAATPLPFVALFPCRLVDTRAPAFRRLSAGGFCLRRRCAATR